jgi:hypothetical protein
MRKLVVLLILLVAFAAGATALADPNLPNIPAHRHYVLTPTGERVEVGPRLCDDPTNPTLQNAFNEFHSNVHRAVAGAPGPAAPGLHNHIGADLVTGPC